MTKILAIDDEKNNLSLVRATMKKYMPDCEVILSQSGKDGIDKAKNELPDVILLDVMMPGLTGYEVCEILKKEEKTKHIPIVFFSAYVKDSHGIIKGLNLGADAFLKKPVDPSELAAQMKVMLRIKSMEDRLKVEVQKYRIIAETLPDALIVLGFDDQITYISPVAVDLFKLSSADDAIGKNAYDLLFSNSTNDVRQLLNEVLVLGVVKDVNLKLQKTDKTEFDAELSVSVINNENNEAQEIILVIKDISQRKQTEKQILDYQRNLKNLNISLGEIEEKERHLIAEYLHDGIGQTLSLAYIHLTTIDHKNLSGKEQESLSESLKMVNSAIEETRSLTFDLSPPILYELGLVPALKWKLKQLEEKYGYQTAFKTDEKNQLMDNNMRILLFRAVSELIANVLKHAEANFVTINYKTVDDYLNISVEDNGKGFVYKSKQEKDKLSGFGFFSIRERLESIEGSLEIQSVKKKGTKASIIIPIKNI